MCVVWVDVVLLLMVIGIFSVCCNYVMNYCVGCVLFWLLVIWFWG